MKIAEKESVLSPAIYEVDISEAWDTLSQLEILMPKIRSLPIYRAGLLYSGFNADHIGVSWGSTETPGVIYCSPEEMIGSSDNVDIDPYKYALTYDHPAIAIYDPEKLEKNNEDGPNSYQLRDLSGILAIIKLK